MSIVVQKEQGTSLRTERGWGSANTLRLYQRPTAASKFRLLGLSYTENSARETNRHNNNNETANKLGAITLVDSATCRYEAKKSKLTDDRMVGKLT